MKFSKTQALFSNIYDKDTNASQRQRLRRFLFNYRRGDAVSHTKQEASREKQPPGHF
jgi:hypothetical protein